jgi:hypothetical protein
VQSKAAEKVRRGSNGGAGWEWRRRGPVLGPIWAQRAAAAVRMMAARWPPAAARDGEGADLSWR